MEPYGWAVEWTLQQPGIMPDEDGDGQKGKPALKADRNQEVDRCPGQVGVLGRWSQVLLASKSRGQPQGQVKNASEVLC